MSSNNFKILVVATSRQTRGGVTSVVKAHETGEQWDQFHCKWIETHRDKGGAYKLAYFLKSFFQYLFLLPFYSLVHIHTSEPPSAIRKSLFLFCAKLWRKKVIVHFHAFSPETTIKSNYHWLYRYLFGKADLILVLSEYWKKEVSQTFGLCNKVKVLYNPCSAPDLISHYPVKNHILYAGTVSERKGYADLIKAFSLIVPSNPQWKIVFAGNGAIEQGKQLAKSLSIEEHTLFLGWVNGHDKSKAFQEASIFCLPSYAEGFPMAVLDAWSYGLPVVTTPVGGLPDVLIDEKNALVFQPGDTAQLSMELQKMIDNESLRQAIAQESTTLAKTVFSAQVICDQLKSIYEDVLA